MESIDIYGTSKRIKPSLRLIVEAIHGRYTDSNFQTTSKTWESYKGWIDGVDKHDFKEFYFTIFDLQTTYGRELSEKFKNSSKGKGVYDFKPTEQFQVKGKIIKKGGHNGFEWVVLKKI